MSDKLDSRNPAPSGRALVLGGGGSAGNVMDPSTRLPAARAGYEQGKILAGQLTGFWR
jgi:hypothetical protein